MPKISEMMPSKFIKQEDIGDEPMLVTIKKVAQYDVGRDDSAEELRWGVEFKEMKKPMLLRTTNVQLCAKACGSEQTEEWIGKQVVLYIDPSVTFGGKVVGGIRIRAPRSAGGRRASAQPTPQAAAAAEVFGDGDDSPF